MSFDEETILEISNARMPLAIKRLKGEPLSIEEWELLKLYDNQLDAYYRSLRTPDVTEGSMLLSKLLARLAELNK